MPRKSTLKLSRRVVEALAVERGDRVFYDRDLTGFGVRVYPSGRKVYIAQARAKGKAAQRVTVAPHGVISPEEARRRAALIISRIKAGEEPVPEPLSATLAKGPTVADIARRYLEDHVAVRCRPRTAEFYRTAVDKYLIPRLGKLPALAVDHARVTELHHALCDKPVMANKVVDTLSRIYNAAEDRGLIPEASNPCGLVVKNRERKRERFLTPDEFQRLGRAPREVTGSRRVSPYSVAAIRLLILTGCRKREILHLRWEQVDLEAAELRLPDTKTGPRRVALSPRALRVLEGIPRLPDSPWAIPGMVAGRPMRNIDEAWGVVCELAGLTDTRIGGGGQPDGANAGEPGTGTDAEFAVVTLLSKSPPKAARNMPPLSRSGTVRASWQASQIETSAMVRSSVSAVQRRSRPGSTQACCAVGNA